MAAPFPTALQRTSDERWVTLDVVAREQDRALARIREAPHQAAVVRIHRGHPYDHHLRDLLSAPPPEPGEGVHVAWPVDLLHDLDARAVGYAAPRPSSSQTFPLADFVDPRRRAEIAPLATRRHLLRVARNVATATAALHHAGHAGIRGSQFRLDDRARVVVVRTDELFAGATAVQQADDQRRLGYLVVRLLGGRPWASEGELATLIRRAGDPALPAAPAQEWFFALRQAERALPKTPVLATTPQVEKRVIVGTDLATALREARDATPGSPRHDPAPAHRAGTGQAVSARSAATPAASTAPAPPAGAATASTARPARTDVATPQRSAAAHARTGASEQPNGPRPLEGSRPGLPGRPSAAHALLGERTAASGVPEDTRSDVRPAVTAAGPARGQTRRRPTGQTLRSRPAQVGRRRRRADHIDGRHTAASATRADMTQESVATLTARRVFGVAVGLTFGGLASVAPFALFLAVAVVMIVRAAVGVGVRKATLGPVQTLAITLTRLVPFATGGLAFAAFILLDLLLVLGLCMALAEQLFGYGPGFGLTWIVQLPEVPGLVRAFAFAVGAFGGIVLGGQAYDRIRRNASGRRMIATPAIAMALAMGILAVDASITWWPLPLVA